jgi:hypothetical protein
MPNTRAWARVQWDYNSTRLRSETPVVSEGNQPSVDVDGGGDTFETCVILEGSPDRGDLIY